MIVINFKNYKDGKEVVRLAKLIEKYIPKSIVCVPAVSMSDVSRKTKLSVYSQHVDSYDGKRGTGKITALEVKKAGASGTLLNHSEHKISIKEIKEAVKECRRVGLKTLVFASNLAEAKKIIKFKSDAVAYEDAKLVGSGKSITEYKPVEIVKFVKLLKGKKIIPLCGAGISSARDVLEAYRLGCSGVVIASAIADTKKPEKILKKISKI